MRVKHMVKSCDRKLRDILQVIEIEPTQRLFTLDEKARPRSFWWQRLWLKFKRTIRKLFGG